MADEIKLKAPTVEQQVVVNINGEEKLRSFADTLEKISNNKNLQKYWKTQQELINATADAYGNFSKKASQDNAKELIKVTNALKAMSGTDLSNILPDFDKISKAMAEAQKVAGNIDSAFSIKGFKEAFDSFETLKAYGVDIQNLFSHFGVSSDVGELQKNVRALEGEVEKLTRRLANAKNANEELRNEFDNFKSGSGFADKLDELDNLKSEMSYLREQAEETFRQFLKLNNITEDGYDRDGFYDDNRFKEYFQNIQSGYLSASDAIQQFKREYSYLLDDSFKSNNDTFGLEQLQAFSNKLDSIFRQVEETSTKINDVISNGVITKSVENLSMDSSLSDSQRSLFGNLLQDEESLKSITTLFQKLIEENNKTSKVDLFNDEQLQQVLSIFDKMEKHLSSLRSIISDVGDGEEFSPLLKMINNVQSSISELATSVKGIGLNMNIDVGSDDELDRKLQTKVANALQAYQKLFNNIKMTSSGGSLINQEFFDFNLDNYDTAYQKLQAIVNFIKKQRVEAKKQFNGYDALYEDSDKSLWKSAQAYLAQVTKVETEIKKANSGESNPLENLFGNTKDLSEVIEQLNKVVEKLNEISSSATEFKNIFKEGFNVTASVEEIDKLTNRVKELEDELSKIKLNPVSVDKSNISSENSIVESQNKIQEELKETQRQAEQTSDSIKGIFVHFGTDFDISKFEKIANRIDGLNKPAKGFWGSFLDSDYGWEQLFENPRKYSTSTYFESNDAKEWFAANVPEKALQSFYKLKEDAHVLVLETVEDLKQLPSKGLDSAGKSLVDWEKVAEKYDAISVKISNSTSEFRQAMYGWDADSLVVTNPNALMQVETPDYKAKEIAIAKQLELYKQLKKEVKMPLPIAIQSEDIELYKSYKAIVKSTENDLKNGTIDANAALEKQQELLKGTKFYNDSWSNKTPIEDVFQGDDKVNTDASTTAIKEESQALEQVSTSAKDAASSKEKFAKANKEVKASADNSNTSLEEEKNKINGIGDSADDTKNQLESMQSALKKYQDKASDMALKPDDAHRFPEYQKHLNKINAAIEEYETFVNLLQGKGIIDEADINEANKLEEVIKNLLKDTKKFSSGDKGFTNIGADKALEKINTILKQNSAMSKKAKAEIKAYYDEIRSGNPTKPLNEILDAVYKIVQKEREAGRAGKSFLEILKEKVIYGGAAQLAGMFGLYDVINVGREGFETIRELDTALTEMKKVSDETTQSLKNYQSTTFDTADAVGTTAQQIQASTADYMRLGESIDDAAESAKTANILLNVSEFESIEDATKSLVSMGQAYKDLDKIEIVDKLNEVGNNYAISTDELSTALQKSAATLSLMGNTIDEAAALVTTANSVIQDADSVSAGIRTISLRLVGTEEAEEELSAMNEEVDAFVKATNSKKQQIIKDYTAVASNNYKGFDILDDNGNYKNTYEINLMSPYNESYMLCA